MKSLHEPIANCRSARMSLVALAAIHLIALPGAATTYKDVDLPPGASVPGYAEPNPPVQVGGLIYLDADTPATGSDLDIAPLVTPHGTITFTGEIRAIADNDMVPAGAAGDGFDIADQPISTAMLEFDFDVMSVTFLYGGNIGVCDVEARDVGGLVLDTFQANTGHGEPVGPAAVSGIGIRSLVWIDPYNNYLSLDNILISPQGTTGVEPRSWGRTKSAYEEGASTE